MKLCCIRWFLCAFIVAGSTLLQAQHSFDDYELLLTEDGLSSNNINDFTQDNNGFLWIATTNGLNQFDGTDVEKYFAGTDDNSLPDNTIYRLICIDTFQIVIATRKGLCVLNTNDFSFKRLEFPLKRENPAWQTYDNHILYLEQDFEGNLWAGTPSSVYCFDKNFRIREEFLAERQIEQMENAQYRFVTKILPLASGEVLFSLNSKLYIWSKNDGMRDVMQLSKWNFLKNQNVGTLFQVFDRFFAYIDYQDNMLHVIDEFSDKKASISLPHSTDRFSSFIRSIHSLKDGWMALIYENNGFFWVKLNQQGDKLSLVSDYKLILPEFTLNGIKQDNEKNFWALTFSKGILKSSGNNQLFVIKEPKQKPNDPVSAYEITNFLKIDNQMFIATHGEGFYIWDQTADEYSHFKFATTALFENIVWNFRQDLGDTVWVGTQSGLFWFNKQDKKYGRLKQAHIPELDAFAITMQYTDSEGFVWIGLGYAGGILRFDMQNRKFDKHFLVSDSKVSPYTFSAIEDKDKNIWFSNSGSVNLTKWNRNDQSFERKNLLQFQDYDNVPLSNLLYIAEKNLIWYGIQSVGLVCFNTQDYRVKSFGLAKGLNTSSIFSLAIDNQGLLWLSTTNGISSFNPETEQFVNHYPMGKTPYVFSANMFYDTDKDIIYAGTVGKLMYFSPSALSTTKKPIKARFTKLVVNGETIRLPEKRFITFSSKTNSISLSFTGINLTNGGENRYAYRLGGEDTAWIDLGKQRQLNFVKLGYGRYTLSVRIAMGEEGWSPYTDTLEFVIHKPFYLTTWFFLLSSFFVFGAIYGWYWFRLQQLKKLEALRMHISHELHDEVGSSLTNIGLMCQIINQEQSNLDQSNLWIERIQNESESTLQSIREIVWNINPDNDSLEEAMPRMLHFATSPLDAKNIKVKASIAELHNVKFNMEERRDLFAIFKETVHNIVNHSEAKSVSISVSVHKNIFSLIVEDDGKGFNYESLSHYNGLKYMQIRANKQHWHLIIQSAPGQGTKISLDAKIP